jgi:hypothetical protein
MDGNSCAWIGMVPNVRIAFSPLEKPQNTGISTSSHISSFWQFLTYRNFFVQYSCY